MTENNILPLRPFYLLRHGETFANVARIVAGGRVDTPLTENGQAQAQALADVIHHLPVRPSRVYHSFLSRARDTAAIVNAPLGLDMVEHPDIHEHEFGDWEGISWDQLDINVAQGLQPTSGETYDAFAQRVRRGFLPILSVEHETPPLIVAHGGVFRGIGQLYGVKTGGVENCCLRLFSPAPENGSFPWKMTQFKPSECGQKLVSSEIFPK